MVQMQLHLPEELLSERLAEVARTKLAQWERKVSLQMVAKLDLPMVIIRNSTKRRSQALRRTTPQAWASSTRAQQLLPKNNLRQFINTRNLK